MNQAQLDRLADWWQHELRLDDWDLTWKLVPARADLLEGCEGILCFNMTHRSAMIHVNRDRDLGDGYEHDIEHTIVHELLHIPLRLITHDKKPQGLCDVECEAFINRQAELLVRWGRELHG